MMNQSNRMPETAIVSKNCVDQSYLLHDLAKSVYARMAKIVSSFGDADKAYTDNVIGVIGNRGCGKTSLLESLVATLRDKQFMLPGSSEQIRIFPLGRPLDPKVLPDCIGIVDFVLGCLYSEFLDLAKTQSEDISNDIYGEFDALILAASALKQKERKSVLENPSDLDDLFQMTNIRFRLSSLVQKLLRLKSGSSITSKSSFLIVIDDYDLDSRNAYSMTLDIMSFLNIDGIILLVSMDENVFEEEIQRGRIKEISDYGEVTRPLFGNRSDDIRLAHRATKYVSLEYQADRYEKELYIKFIPIAARISFHSFDLANDNLAVFNEVVALINSLFGFETRELEEAPLPKKAFIRELTNWTDLRTRNQVINGLLDIYEKGNDGSSCKQVFGEIGSFLDRNVPANQGKEIVEVATLLREDLSRRRTQRTLTGNENDLFFSMGKTEGRISILGKDYFDNHPAAVLIYDWSVELFLTSAGNEYKQFFDVIETITRGKVKRSSVSENSMSYGDVSISAASMFDTLEQGGISILGSSVSQLIREPSKITKPIALSIAQKLKDYLIVRSVPTSLAKETIQRAINAIQESCERPWRQVGETQKRREEIRAALLRCRKYLR